MFTVHFFSFSCNTCGRIAEYVHAGVSHRGEFIAEWRCIDCGKEIVAGMSIEKMIKCIPPPPKEPEETAQLDLEFLKEMNILPAEA